MFNPTITILSSGAAMNWDAIRDEVTRVTQDLIRFDTTNPPGNETPCIETIAAVLRREGIEPVALESAPGRGNLVARLKGDGSQPPILLMGHVDVVPAEADHWQRPPFSGDLVDGIVWGRGATDMKQMVAMELMTMLLLKRAGRRADAGGRSSAMSSSWSMPTRRPAASWAPASSPSSIPI